MENMRTAHPILLTDAERRTLQRLAQSADTERLSQRAHIVLLAAQGWQNNHIASELKTDPQTVGRWRSRFASHRLAGIEEEAPRSGRRRYRRDGIAAEIVRRTQRRRSRHRCCSCRQLAEELHINHMLVYRVWKDHGLIESSDAG